MSKVPGVNEVFVLNFCSFSCPCREQSNVCVSMCVCMYVIRSPICAALDELLFVLLRFSRTWGYGSCLRLAEHNHHRYRRRRLRSQLKNLFMFVDDIFKAMWVGWSDDKRLGQISAKLF